MKYSLRFSAIFAICFLLSSAALAQQKVSADSNAITSTTARNSSSLFNAPPAPEPVRAVSSEYTAPNALYLELLGAGLFYSVNYERMLTNHFALRLGFGTIGIGTVDNGDGTTSSTSITMVPVTLSFFPFSDIGGIPSSKLEIGVGVSYARITSSYFGSASEGSGLVYTGIFGYRYQPYDGGFLFRIAFTPLYLFSRFLPYAGLSLGFSF